MALSPAEKAFKKEEMRREGEKNMAEYRQAQMDQQKKTDRLRALRLAQEAGIAAAQAEPIAPVDPAPAKKKSKKKPAKKKTH